MQLCDDLDLGVDNYMNMLTALRTSKLAYVHTFSVTECFHGHGVYRTLDDII
jgi:hypothetical protein